MSRVVLYAEVPCFYAAVERAADPALAERPVIVGGDPRRRGVVQEASFEARAAGVEPGMTVEEALQRCPRARALRTQMARYREASQVLRALLRRRIERLEPEGLGAAYLDPSGLAETPADLARDLCSAVESALGLPLRIGIGSTKLVARLAAEEAGERGAREVPAGEEAAFLGPLSARRLPGVGPGTASKLAELGAKSVAEVEALGRDALERALGNRGLELLALARGAGPSEVRGTRAPQSLSQEETLETPERETPALRRQLGELARRLEGMLRVHGLVTRRMTLKARYVDGETVTRSQTLSHGIASAADLEAAGAELLSRTEAGRRPVRLLGLTLAQLQRGRRDDRQLDLFSRRG
ncbi:MAG TPA: DNA polymerase IV [Myxococcota bacterium]|nr:DNA polymerase IV [Myxococcota bacterium]